MTSYVRLTVPRRLTPEWVRRTIARSLDMPTPSTAAELHELMAAIVEGRDWIPSILRPRGMPVEVDAEIARLRALGYERGPSRALQLPHDGAPRAWLALARQAAAAQGRPTTRAAGYGRTVLALLATMLRHEPPSSPRAALSLTPGRRIARVAMPSEPRGGRTGQPSRRYSALTLRTLVQAVRDRRCDLYAETIVALYLLHEGLDAAPAIMTSRSRRPPTGDARVAWVARRVRAICRPSRADRK